MAVLADALHAIYYKKKPFLGISDYDIDRFANPVSHEDPAAASLGATSPRDQLEVC